MPHKALHSCNTPILTNFVITESCSLDVAALSAALQAAPRAALSAALQAALSAALPAALQAALSAAIQAALSAALQAALQAALSAAPRAALRAAPRAVSAALPAALRYFSSPVVNQSVTACGGTPFQYFKHDSALARASARSNSVASNRAMILRRRQTSLSFCWP